MQPLGDIPAPMQSAHLNANMMPGAEMARMAEGKQQSQLTQYVSPTGTAAGAQSLETQVTAYRAAAVNPSGQ